MKARSQRSPMEVLTKMGIVKNHRRHQVLKRVPVAVVIVKRAAAAVVVVVKVSRLPLHLPNHPHQNHPHRRHLLVVKPRKAIHQNQKVKAVRPAQVPNTKRSIGTKSGTRKRIKKEIKIRTKTEGKIKKGVRIKIMVKASTVVRSRPIALMKKKVNIVGRFLFKIIIWLRFFLIFEKNICKTTISKFLVLQTMISEEKN